MGAGPLKFSKVSALIYLLRILLTFEKWGQLGGLKPSAGREVFSILLAKGLTKKRESVCVFSTKEAASFGLPDLRYSDYIKAGEAYFAPSPPPLPDPPPLLEEAVHAYLLLHCCPDVHQAQRIQVKLLPAPPKSHPSIIFPSSPTLLSASGGGGGGRGEEESGEGGGGEVQEVKAVTVQAVTPGTPIYSVLDCAELRCANNSRSILSL